MILPIAALNLRNIYRQCATESNAVMHPKLFDIDKLASRDMAQLHYVLGGADTRALHCRQAHWQSTLGGRSWPQGTPGLLEEDSPGGPVSSPATFNALVTIYEV